MWQSWFCTSALFTMWWYECYEFVVVFLSFGTPCGAMHVVIVCWLTIFSALVHHVTILKCIGHVSCVHRAMECSSRFVIHGKYIYKQTIVQFFFIPPQNCVLNAGKPSRNIFSCNIFVHRPLHPRYWRCKSVLSIKESLWWLMSVETLKIDINV